MLRTFPILAALVAVSLASPAVAHVARNGLSVERVGAHDFRVAFGGKSGAAAFWCAAGDFALHRLGLGVTDRIWRLTPVPRRSGEAMAFSTRPDNAAGSTGLVILFGRNDGSLSVASALRYCEVPGG